MTDKEKLDNFVAEIEKRISRNKERKEWEDIPEKRHQLIIEGQLLGELKHFIDSMQEEPSTSVWHDISEKPKMNSIIVMNNSQTTLSVEYVGQSLCGVERWAYLDILLKL